MVLLPGSSDFARGFIRRPPPAEAPTREGTARTKGKHVKRGARICSISVNWRFAESLERKREYSRLSTTSAPPENYFLPLFQSFAVSVKRCCSNGGYLLISVLAGSLEASHPHLVDRAVPLCGHRRRGLPVDTLNPSVVVNRPTRPAPSPQPRRRFSNSLPQFHAPLAVTDGSGCPSVNTHPHVPTNRRQLLRSTPNLMDNVPQLSGRIKGVTLRLGNLVDKLAAQHHTLNVVTCPRHTPHHREHEPVTVAVI
jgi:hypothetical protein